MEELNKNQFVYKREIEIPPVEEDKEKEIIAAEGYTKIVYDSFNIECVIRAITMDDDKLLVLLDDLHERNEKVPKLDRNNRPVMKKAGGLQMVVERNTFQSEIYLSQEEAKEFYKLTAINSYE